MGDSPSVSVIIATYNRSDVLAYAIRSALAQSFADFELLVIGDACTDDSEAVVRSFGDARIVWENLPQNCGSQFGPNNRGLALARGRYIAYLGHDDLWHRDHLAALVRAIEDAQADLVFAIAEDVAPPPRTDSTLMGVSPSGGYEWTLWAPPSAWLHRRDVPERIGAWRDYRSITLPVDVDFLSRADEQGLRIVPVAELTVFKFTSVARTEAYRARGAEEQARWWERLQRDPELRYRELLDVLRALAARHPEIAQRFSLPSRVAPGSIAEAYRRRRGLRAAPAAPQEAASEPPLFANRRLLRLLNAEDDIGPEDARRALHAGPEPPVDGLFIGYNWHSLERDEAGARWRWLDDGAQIVVTRPSGAHRRLALDIVPGPGVAGRKPRLELRDAAGAIVAAAVVRDAGVVVLDLPNAAGQGAAFALGTPDGGRTIKGDPRILNFRVNALRWSAPGDGASEPAWRRAWRRVAGRRHHQV